MGATMHLGSSLVEFSTGFEMEKPTNQNTISKLLSKKILKISTNLYLTMQKLIKKCTQDSK